MTVLRIAFFAAVDGQGQTDEDPLSSTTLTVTGSATSGGSQPVVPASSGVGTGWRTAVMTASDAAIYVDIAGTPDPTTDPRHLVIPGQVLRVHVKAGDKISAILAADVTLAGTALAAGAAIIGKVGIDQTTPGTTDHVTGSGIATAVGATLTRPADTSAYAVGDIVAQSTTAGSCSGVAVAVARGNDLTGMLRRCRVKVNDTAWLNAQVYIHVFKDAPTFTAGDNAAFAGNLTESLYIGAFDVTLDRQFSDPFVKGIGVPRAGSEMNFEPHSGSQNVYFVIETRTAVTPASGKVFTVVFEVLQN